MTVKTTRPTSACPAPRPIILWAAVAAAAVGFCAGIAVTSLAAAKTTAAGGDAGVVSEQERSPSPPLLPTTTGFLRLTRRDASERDFCSQVQSSQLHGPLSNEQATDLLDTILADAAATAAADAASAFADSEDRTSASQRHQHRPDHQDCPLRPLQRKLGGGGGGGGGGGHQTHDELYVSWRSAALFAVDSNDRATPTTKTTSTTTTATTTHLLSPPPKHLREQACAAHPDFCDTLYPRNETDRIAQLIYDHQNPRDCSQSNFLVLTREWHSGLGSNIHVKAWMLLVAIMSNRVLIDSPQIKWNMTNPRNCPKQDWTCYFAPVTHCTLPADWDASKTPEFATEDLSTQAAGTPSLRTTRQYVRAIAYPQLLSGSLAMGQQHSVDRIPKSFGRGSSSSRTFYMKPNSWWMTHATMYLIRPNERTLEVACWYWRCMPTNHDNGRRFGQSRRQQQPLASIFVRSGDKWKEANLRTAREHFDALDVFVRANPALRPATVYFGTDNALVLSDVVRQYGQRYNVTWIGYHRDVKGLSFEETITRGFSPKIEWQVLVSLADLYISSLADIFVGTLSSNWCRLGDEIRKAHGKAGLPYLTPSGEALVAGV